MATHSSILAWWIPGTEEPGGLQSTGSQRIGHNWSDLAHMHSCSGGKRMGEQNLFSRGSCPLSKTSDLLLRLRTELVSLMRPLQVAQTQEAATGSSASPESGESDLARSLRLKTSHTVQANGALELWFSDSMDTWGICWEFRCSGPTWDSWGWTRHVYFKDIPLVNLIIHVCDLTLQGRAYWVWHQAILVWTLPHLQIPETLGVLIFPSEEMWLGYVISMSFEL